MATSRPRKFKIEPFKHPLGKLDPSYAETTWALLRNAIQEINSHNASGLSFEELYRNAYHMVVYKFGDRLYQGLVQVEREHLSGVAARIESVGSESFLRTLKSEWEAHVKSVAMIRDILMYLDRIYVRQQGLTPVHSLGLRLWRAVVVGAPPIRERLVSLFLSEVARERRGERGDRSLLRATSQMLEDLGRDEYEAVLEEPYIAATREFYAAEGAAREQADDVPSYLKHVEARLAEEADRVHALLASFSEAKVAGALEAELVAAPLARLLASDRDGLVPLLLADRVEDLRRFYALARRVPGGVESLQRAFGEQVLRSGRALVEEQGGLVAEAAPPAPPPARAIAPASASPQRDAVEYIGRLLALRQKYEALVVQAFGADRRFQTALNGAFENFFNLDPRGPEHLSAYADDVLRNGAKGVPEDELEAVLDRVIQLFRYLADKDVFERCYKHHLARRLLVGRGRTAEEAERALIVRLKTECGYQFTSKLESMFVDVKTSRDMMAEYRAARGSGGLGALAPGGDGARSAPGGDGSRSAPGTPSARREEPNAALLGPQAEAVLSASAGAGWAPAARGAGPLGGGILQIRSRQGSQSAGPSAEALAGGAAAAVPAAAAAGSGAAGTGGGAASFGTGGGAASLAAGGPELSVQVLTTGSWPLSASAAACALPREVEACLEDFGSFYHRAYSGRRLAWQTALGSAELKASFGGRRHELSASPQQACVLVLFNEQDSLTTAQIAAATRIPEPELRRVLASLSCVKGRAVLAKDPPGREVGEDDAWRVNEAFSSKLYRVKLGSAVAAAREAEDTRAAAARERAMEDRKPQIEAAIVRVLKARRVLSHNDVVAEVTRQLASRFSAQPALIKKRIESLIEREFVERDGGDRSLYRYVA